MHRDIRWHLWINCREFWSITYHVSGKITKLGSVVFIKSRKVTQVHSFRQYLFEEAIQSILLFGLIFFYCALKICSFSKTKKNLISFCCDKQKNYRQMHTVSSATKINIDYVSLVVLYMGSAVWCLVLADCVFSHRKWGQSQVTKVKTESLLLDNALIMD